MALPRGAFQEEPTLAYSWMEGGTLTETISCQHSRMGTLCETEVDLNKVKKYVNYFTSELEDYDSQVWPQLSEHRGAGSTEYGFQRE